MNRTVILYSHLILHHGKSAAALRKAVGVPGDESRLADGSEHYIRGFHHGLHGEALDHEPQEDDDDN